MAELMIVRRGGGGAALNVITATNKAALPSSPTKNTVALITDETIERVYVKSSYPTIVSDGDVFFQTQRPNKYIDIATDGALEVGIAGAYLRSGGVWQAVDTYVYLSGAWALLWSDQLFYKGNTYNAYTGGWIGKDIKPASGSDAERYVPTITNTGTTLILDQSDKGEYASGVAYLAKMIDLTPYKSFVLEGEFLRSGSKTRNFTTAAWSSFGSYYTQNMLASQELASDNETRIELDITSVNQAAYIGVGIAATNKSSDANGGVTRATISRAYLVPKDE